MRARRPQAFLRNALAYSSTSFLCQGLSFAEHLIVRRILPPLAMGVWELALVIQSTVNVADPGITVAARFELPRLDGAAAADEERRGRTTTLWAVVAFSVLQVLAVLAYAWWALTPSRDEFLSAIGASFLILPTALGAVFQLFLQGRQLFIPLSKAALCSAVLSAVLLPLGAYVGGAVGLLSATVAAVGFQPLLLYLIMQRAGLRVTGGWHRGALKRLLGFGLPLRLVDAPQSLLGILDTLCVSWWLGLEPLALYAIVKSCLLQAVAVTIPAWNVFMMRTFHLSGAQVERGILAQQARRALLVQLLILNPLLIALLVPAFEFLVRRIIPSYAASAPLVRVLALSVYFLPQTTQIRNFWMLDREFGALGLSNLVGLICLAGSLGALTWTRGATLETIALGTVLGYAGYFFYVVLAAGTGLWGARQAVTVALHALASVAATGLVVHLLPSIDPSADLETQLWELSQAVAMAALALAPLVLYGAWRTQLLGFVRRDLGWSPS